MSSKFRYQAVSQQCAQISGSSWGREAAWPDLIAQKHSGRGGGLCEPALGQHKSHHPAVFINLPLGKTSTSKRDTRTEPYSLGKELQGSFLKLQTTVLSFHHGPHAASITQLPAY